MTHLAKNSRTTADTSRPSARAFSWAANQSSSGMRMVRCGVRSGMDGDGVAAGDARPFAVVGSDGELQFAGVHWVVGDGAFDGGAVVGGVGGALSEQVVAVGAVGGELVLAEGDLSDAHIPTVHTRVHTRKRFCGVDA